MATKKTLSPTTTPKRTRAVTAAAAKPEKAPKIVKTPARPRARRPTVLVTADQIRERAYFLSLERGGGQSDPDADWAQAERELAGAGRK
ncbi:MAG: DUF2934 domain-containing protein [Acidobacteriota bacterium]